MFMSDNSDEIDKAIDKVLSENETAVAGYKAGNAKLFGFLMGRVIGEIGKGANPAAIKEALSKKI